MATKIYSLKEIREIKEVTETAIYEKLKTLPYDVPYTARELNHYVMDIATPEHFTSTFHANMNRFTTHYHGLQSLKFKMCRGVQRKRYFAELNKDGEIICKFEKNEIVTTYTRIK